MPTGVSTIIRCHVLSHPHALAACINRQNACGFNLAYSEIRRERVELVPTPATLKRAIRGIHDEPQIAERNFTRRKCIIRREMDTR
jgi:hypothetical protein